MSETVSRRYRLLRRLSISFMSCAIIVAVLSTAYCLYRWNRVGQIPDIGDPFDVEAWLVPDLPDDENAATVYRRAFQLLGNATAPLPDGTPLWHAMREPPVADEELFLEVTLPLCQLLRQGAAMPHALFTRPQDVSIEVQGVEDGDFVRQTFRLVQARSRILRTRGELNEAMLDLTGVVALARHLSAKGSFIQHLTANPVEALTLEEIRDCAGDSKMTAELAASSLADLRRLQITPGASDILKVEYLYSMKYFFSPEALEGYRLFHEEMYGKFGLTRDGTVLGPLSRPFPVIGCTSRIEVERAKRLLKLATANLLAACELPPYERPAVVEEAVKVQSAGISAFRRETIELFDLEGMSDSLQVSREASGRQVCQWLATTPWLVEDSVRSASVLVPFDRIAARRGITETFLALRAWQIRHGKYPETLGELVGHDLDALPLDPFSGRPFGYVRASGQVLRHAGPGESQYQTKADDWLLYSVGPDKIDQQASVECVYGSGSGDWIFLLP